MNKLAMFVPLAKADATQRLVYGYIDETPDRAGEVMDYASSKPHFEAWSDTFAKATDGKSVGNLRAQHGKTAAGKFEKIAFDDANKRIELCARIVDDNEWAKVEEGVYTGFSPGGRYAKRWQDGGYRRYTALPSEISIVDLPCIPTATFTMIKADGVEEQVEFVMDKAYEPGNEATKARAEEMAKSADGSWKDFVQQARADLISENAAEALAKMAGDEEEVTGGESASAQPASDTTAQGGLLDSLNAALAKADTVLVVDNEGAITPVALYASALTGTLLKSDMDLPVAPPSPEAVALIGADLGKSIAAVEAIRAAVAPQLEKGLYSLSDAVSSLQSFAWITQSVTDEAGWEGDNSPLPQMAVDILRSIKAFLIAMVEEEVSEMLSRLKADAGTDVALVIEGDEMELATQIVDLVKADTVRMEKAGARNSKNDAARIQAIHDKAGELGAACARDEGNMTKAAELEETNAQLTKAVTEALPRLEALTTELTSLRESHQTELAKMQAEIERLGGQPAASKIEQVVMRDKAEDNGTLAKDGVDQFAGMSSSQRTRALEAEALQRLAQHPG
jgi:hypothetical protein